MITSACSSGKTLDASAALTNLMSQVTYSEQLEWVDYEIFLKRAGIDTNIVSNATVYMGSAAVVDTIAMIETTDTAAVEESLRSYIESQRASYTSYRPDEVPKLDNAVLNTYGNSVVLCITADNDNAKAAIESALK